MGNCCSIKPEIRLNRISVRPLLVYFLNIKKKCVYKIEEEKLLKVVLPKFYLYDNAAIGHLIDNTILIAGGKKQSGRLSRKVTLLSPQGSYVLSLPRLVQGVFKGNIFQIGSAIYYISDDLNLPHQRYLNKRWELVDCKRLNLTNISVLKQEAVLYFLCGKKANGKITKKMYFIDTEKEWVYQEMKHKLNFKLVNPIAYSAYDFVVVAGGKKINGCHNFSYYIQNNWEWAEFLGPDIELERYPCLYINRLCVFIGKRGKVVTLDCDLKFKVYQNKCQKRVLRKSVTDINIGSNPRAIRYRRNSYYLQAVLNNYVSHNHSHSNHLKDENESDSDSLNSDHDCVDKTPSLILSSFTRNECSPADSSLINK